MRDIIDESDDGASAALSYTHEFFEAAVAMIDERFGDGFAQSNPALIGALVEPSATNLTAFMTAASNIPNDLASLLDQMGPEMFEEAPPAAKPARKKK
ncbi:MAG: hypothetical protein GVY06_01365 [Alphaproteobacteria bacterium]|jgi:hypothetical protein|nr:hypothetical protein [Alphaproteobacteria bacterium]